jgi:DNA polymerase-3 subunit alpha
MQKFMKELQPTNLEDVILGISVYRPGPMDSIPILLEGKKNPSSIQYPEDAKHLLAPILDVTYGVIVYQEQVMQIVRDLAGYSFGRSDLVRRAMAKKKPEVMEAERYIFVYGEVKCPECGGTGKQANGDKCILCKGAGAVASKVKCPWCKGENENCTHCNGTGIMESDGEVTVEGCLRNGISEETANYLFDKMIDFAAYAFNKSHATAYAIIGYQTAFLKYYYPRQYMTAYLNSVIANQEKVRKYLGIVKRMGISVLRPDINKCEAKFIQNEDGIYMGLTSLKYVGAGVQEAIEERKKNGPFKDLQDLLERVTLNKREVESLIKSGALDCFGHKRSQMLSSLDALIKGAKKERENRESGQLTLFDFADEELKEAFKFHFPDISEYNPMEKFSMEKEVSGFYLSGHPLDLPEHQRFTKRSNITTIDGFTEGDDRKDICIVGIIQIDEKEGGFKISKAGKQYAIFDIEDKYSTLRVLAFEKCLEKSGHLIQAGSIVELQGTLSVQVNEFEDENGEIVQTFDVKIFANEIKALGDIDRYKKVYIRIDRKTAHYLPHIKQLANRYPGTDELYIYNSEEQRLLKYNNTIGYNDNFYKEIRHYLDEQSVAIR